MLLFYLSLLETAEEKSKFEQLYYEHRKLMMQIAIDMLHDEFVAEDAVHEAFVKLTRHLDGVDEINSHKTKAFIVIIIKSVCSDMIRKEKRNTEIKLENVDYIGRVSDDSFKNLEVEEVYSVISSLPDTYREIIELKVVHDLSDKQIADVLGISNSAVRKRLQRAREILRNKLAEWGEEYVSV